MDQIATRWCGGSGWWKTFAGVGRVRTAAFSSILRDVFLLYQTCEPVKFWHAPIILLQLDRGRPTPA